MAKEKVVLAYSGGLDTSVIMTWLKENLRLRRYRRMLQRGTERRLRCRSEKKALATGAVKAYTCRPERGIHNRLHMAYPEGRRHLRRPVHAGNIHGKASYG